MTLDPILALSSNTNGDRVPPPCHWRALAPRFPAERDCLAAFVALEAAEVIGGAKPANLVRLSRHPQPCGRNLSDLWHRHGDEVMQQSQLEVAILRETEETLLLLFYRPDLLERRLAGRGAATFLRRAGYPSPHRMPQVLEQLRSRFRDRFPHEVGFFLGYPLKDVTAFMGWRRLPVSDQCLWKIYGHPHRSRQLADHYRDMRCRMAAQLAVTHHTEQLLAAAVPCATPPTAFRTVGRQ